MMHFSAWLILLKTLGWCWTMYTVYGVELFQSDIFFYRFTRLLQISDLSYFGLGLDKTS